MYDSEVFETLKKGGVYTCVLSACMTNLNHCVCVGVDDLLAQHIAHLFIRDPISLFAEKLEQSPDNETDHFEVHSYA